MTVRLRLTLLYGVLFLFSGALLLTITYLLMLQKGSSISMSTHSPITAGGQTVNTVVVQTLPGSVVNALPGGALTEAEGRLRDVVEAQASARQSAIMRQLITQSGIALAIMAVVAAGLGRLVAGRVLRPLQTMTSSIRQISARNVHERLAATGPRDELRNLAETIDGLLGRLESALESHKRFVANAAHELRTPLTLEHALLEEAVIDPDATAETFRARFGELMVLSEQQARLLESLLVLATSERGLDRRESVDLSALTGDVLRATRPGGPEVVADLGPAPVTGDPALVESLVANLVDNAMSYNVPGGRVEVATGTRDERTFLAVTNTGPPVPPEMVDRLLHPFQRLDRTAADDGHHGLGLSIVQAIVTAHAAELTVRARPAGGLELTVLFAAEKAVLVPVV
ncbi:ATP-binding protein [Actinoplanes sp. NPDC026619]|uniref:sensor histidine kinase n=1 Tax=Actinoplanes sp. NPDC026619 TaxID=3155798 RepID=UPI0033CE10FF